MVFLLNLKYNGMFSEKEYNTLNNINRIVCFIHYDNDFDSNIKKKIIDLFINYNIDEINIFMNKLYIINFQNLNLIHYKVYNYIKSINNICRYNIQNKLCNNKKTINCNYCKLHNNIIIKELNNYLYNDISTYIMSMV